MERRLSISLILCSLLAACGPSGFQAPIKNVYTQPQQTYMPPTPELKKAGNVEYIAGALKVLTPTISINGASHLVQMTGSLQLSPRGGGDVLNIPMSISGTIGEDYKALLKPTDAQALTQQGLELGAKLTCVYSDCSDSFIDIYVKHQGVVYHSQVEAQSQKQKDTLEVIPETAQEAAPKASQPLKISESAPAPKAPAVEPEAEETETETEEVDEDHGHDARANGYYVGTREEDINEIFTSEKPKSPGASKKDDAKKETPKKTPVITPPVKRDTSVPNPPEASSTYSWQAQGKPFKGRLFNAVNIYKFSEEKATPGFRILYPEKELYYGTSYMLEMLIQMGKFSYQKIQKYNLVVNTISAKNGGFLRGHQSHQTGMDVDVAYLFDNREMRERFTPAVVSGKPRSEWMIEDQWKLFKYAVKTDYVDRIFVDGAVKRALCDFAKKNGELENNKPETDAYQTLRVLVPEPSHGNHFHLRIRQECPPQEARCFQMVPPPNVTNCKS